MNLLHLAVSKVEGLGQTPVPQTVTLPLWQNGKGHAFLKSTEEGLDLFLVANGRCSGPLHVGYVEWRPDGSWRWAVSRALDGLAEGVLGRRVNTPTSCYRLWVEDTRRRLGL